MNLARLLYNSVAPIPYLHSTKLTEVGQEVTGMLARYRDD